jgi:hypothetical protein
MNIVYANLKEGSLFKQSKNLQQILFIKKEKLHPLGKF